MNRLRQVVLGVWVVALVGVLTHYLFHREHYSPENLAAFLQRHESWALLLFLILSVVRAVVLLPATPLVLAGALLMPGQPWRVLFISLAGIALASTLIYRFSEWLGFRPHFERAAPEQVRRIERWLRHPWGAVCVAGWALFPFVPTDLVCYVAGTVRMPFGRFLGAILAGESILCAVYVFGGSWLSRSIF